MTEKIKTLDGAIRERARREWDMEVNRVLNEKSAVYKLLANLPGYTGLRTEKAADLTFMSALHALERAAKDRGYAAAENRAIDMHLREVADLKGRLEALGDLDRPRYDEEGEPIF
jgi:hypothetical protein